MATELEIRTACKLVDDNVDLNESLTDLSAIEADAGDIDIFFRLGDKTFSLARLSAKLEEQGDDFDTMVAAIQTAVRNAIGADDVTAGTIRKAIKDLADANDVRIAAT